MKTFDLPRAETIAAYLRAAAPPAPPAPSRPGPTRTRARSYPKHPEFEGLHGAEYQAAYQAMRRKRPGHKARHTKYTREWRRALREKEEAV